MKIHYKELQNELIDDLSDFIINKDVVFLCIGTDRSTGDSLAPMIGTILTERGYDNVIGTLNNPVHAINLEDTLNNIDDNKTIIAIDASLGRSKSIGKIMFDKCGIKPGSGVGKNLGEVGDYHIAGIVNVSGYMEYFVLQSTRLSLIVDLARTIADNIDIALSINELNKNQIESKLEAM